jgi:hypothetical protein
LCPAASHPIAVLLKDVMLSIQMPLGERSLSWRRFLVLNQFRESFVAIHLIMVPMGRFKELESLEVNRADEKVSIRWDGHD